MLAEKEVLMADVQRGVEQWPMPLVDKLTRLAWLISRAESLRELDGYARALRAIEPTPRLLN